MESILWLIASPLLFLLPGLLPARLVSGGGFSAATWLWSAFFSVLLLPVLCFGLAMLFGTVVGPAVVLPTAAVLAALGLVVPIRKTENAD